MDKNMIKIDDLLRQRFEGAEEQERAGAWGNMRDLLDKQMPVNKVPAATNWRRMFAYVAGVVLLAAVSVGGYQMSESFSSGDGSNIAYNSNITGNRTAPVTTGLAGTAINSLPETADAQSSTTTADVEHNTVAGTQQIVEQAEQPVTVPAKAAKATPTAPQKADMDKFASGTTGAAAANSKMSNTPKDVATASTKADKPVTGKTVEHGAIAGNTANSKATAPTATDKMNNTPADNMAKQDMSKTAKNNNSKSGNNSNNITKQSAPGKMSTSGMEENPVAINTPEPQYEDVPVQKTVRHETIGADGKPVMDTIFNGEDVMKRRLPSEQDALAANTADDENSGSNMMPSSAAPSAKKEASDEEANMQRLGDHMVSRKKMKNFNPSRFEEMVQNAKFRMGSVKFYPGVVAGANASFNGNLGAHVGFAGNLTISERWAILTEVKFAYTFNNTKQDLKDDYIDNVQPTVVNNQALYKYDSIDHHFNFNSYTNFEVPLMVTYTKNKYIFMAGADFRYNMGITSIQEVKEKYLSEKPYYSTSEPTFETEESILLSDFGSKMNIGPMLGFGYQFDRGFRLDVRATKSVWNNANTVGEKQVSKGLYDMPQLQLNMTWRFSRSKPYKRK